jgi:hypothetical protein
VGFLRNPEDAFHLEKVLSVLPNEKGGVADGKVTGQDGHDSVEIGLQRFRAGGEKADLKEAFQFRKDLEASWGQEGHETLLCIGGVLKRPHEGNGADEKGIHISDSLNI